MWSSQDAYEERHEQSGEANIQYKEKQNALQELAKHEGNDH